MPGRSNDQALLERIQSAAAVVVGRVREIREVTGAQPKSSQGGHAVISEHGPAIAEAVIEVSEGIKGAEPGEDIVVRFPTSNDVMWYSYPKFSVGDSGVFILQPDSLTCASAALAPGIHAPAFNARHRQDVLPFADVERVRKAARPL